MNRSAYHCRPPIAAAAHNPLHRKSFGILLLAIAVVMVPGALRANQVSKACGSKWVQRAMKLEPEKLAWLLKERIAEFSADLDHDGKPDLVKMTNYPNLRSCEIKKLWDQKETNVRIEYGTGKTKMFHWMSDQVVERLVLYPHIGRILVVAVDAHGKQISRWLKYSLAPAPSVDTRVAEASQEPAADETQIADLTPATAPAADGLH